MYVVLNLMKLQLQLYNKWLKLLKKKGVLVGNCEGFVGNRAFAVYVAEAQSLIEDGCLPQEIDQVLYKFGWAMGPFQVSDLSGNDIGYRHREEKNWIKDQSSRPKGRYPFTIADRLVEMGRLGQKSNQGWYDYDAKRKNQPSKIVEQLIIKVSKEKNITRKKFNEEEIIQRCLYPMVNESFKILEEGIALRPSDVDIVFVYGYGFPAYRGGLLFWADLEGLIKIRDTLKKYQQQFPDTPYFKVSKLLDQLANQNTTLEKYWKQKDKSQKSKL